ncbi:uncharacterized protein TrAtP1_001673 [Trichoderma atroviride]|uniref:uncharacterized protein n=1 Tax=Hypocrea atroviridis TaxID=63577 RepID=UPI0033343275|nr:hypothetical protein TrAtP1_001673 [Trichoderma atroviride]
MPPLHLDLQPQPSGTGQQGRCAPVSQRTFVGDGSICSRAAIRRQRGSGTEEAWVRRFWLGASQEPGPGIILHPGFTLISILRMHLVMPDGRSLLSLLVRGNIRIEQNYKHPMALMPSCLPHRAIQIACEVPDVRAALGPYKQLRTGLNQIYQHFMVNGTILAKARTLPALSIYGTPIPHFE